jgi:hypothetical protein
VPCRRGGFRMVCVHKHLLKAVAAAFDVDMDAPYESLPNHSSACCCTDPAMCR